MLPLLRELIRKPPKVPSLRRQAKKSRRCCLKTHLGLSQDSHIKCSKLVFLFLNNYRAARCDASEGISSLIFIKTILTHGLAAWN